MPRSDPRVIDEGGKLLTICLDRRTGKILWKREAPRPRLEVYQPTNSPASPSPVTDGKTVYVFFGDFGVIAYTFDGTERWKLPLGPFNNANGHGSSPVLVDDLLILLCDQDSNSYLLAVDKESGRVRWKTERPDVTRSYSTPGVLRPRARSRRIDYPGLLQARFLQRQNRREALVDRRHVLAAEVDPGDRRRNRLRALVGKRRRSRAADRNAVIHRDACQVRYRQGQEDFARRVRAGPAHAARIRDNDLANDGFVDERDWSFYHARRSSRNALLAVRTGARGDLTGSSNILWRMQKFLPNTPSPLLYRGVLYLIKDGGILTSVNPKTGEILKQGRLPGALDTYYASPVAGAGHVYV